jgi:hypothetical protein
MKVSSIVAAPFFALGVFFGSTIATLAWAYEGFRDCLEAALGVVMMPFGYGIEYGEKHTRESLTPKMETPDEV